MRRHPAVPAARSGPGRAGGRAGLTDAGPGPRERGETIAGLLDEGPDALEAFFAPDLSDSDRGQHTDPGELDNLREFFRQGVDAYVEDHTINGSDWAHLLPRPTRIWQGDDDNNVPAEATRWLAEQIPGAELTLLPGAGHSFGDGRRAADQDLRRLRPHDHLAEQVGRDAATYRILEALQEHPVLTAAGMMRLLEVSRPAALAALDELTTAGVLEKKRLDGRTGGYLAMDVFRLITFAERQLASTRWDTSARRLHARLPMYRPPCRATDHRPGQSFSTGA